MSGSLVLVDPSVVSTAPVNDALGKPKGNLLLGAINSITTVNDVPGQGKRKRGSNTDSNNKSQSIA